MRLKLTYLLGVLAAVQLALLAFFAAQFAAYQGLASEVNTRWSVPDPRIFVTSNDPAVQSTVRTVTYGNIDPAKDEDLRLYLRMLFDWVSANIRPRSDSPYPMLPASPSGGVSFTDEVWQYPNETLALRSGDCEDAATLLLSMVRFYAPRLKAACIVAEGEKGGHAAVIVANGSDVAVLDPGLYYCTKDEVGFLAFRPLLAELSSWLPKVEQKIGAGARVTTLFNESECVRFRSTNEFIAYFYLHFKG